MTSVPTVNSQSTGLVLQGLAGLGYSPGKLTSQGRTGLDFLRARQRSSGSIAYSAQSDQTAVWVTADALVALSGKSLPVKGPARQPVTPDSSAPAGTGAGGSSSGGGSGTGGSGSGSGQAPGQGSGGASAGSGGDAGSGSDGLPLPGGGSVAPDGASPFATTPVAPTAELLEASQAGDSPSAALAILIGLGTAALVVAAVTALAKRRRW